MAGAGGRRSRRRGFVWVLGSTVTTLEPETRYARAGDVRVAYQVMGDGPRDLVLVPGFVSNLELAWEHPPYERFMRRISSFARVIVFDKRGSGLSDPVDRAATIEERTDEHSRGDGCGRVRAGRFARLV